jgi:hypothetical protein
MEDLGVTRQLRSSEAGAPASVRLGDRLKSALGIGDSDVRRSPFSGDLAAGIAETTENVAKTALSKQGGRNTSVPCQCGCR